MTISKNKKTISKVLAWIGLILIFLFIIGIIYGLITKNGMFVIAMIAGLTLISLLYRWGIMAFKKVYSIENKDLDKKDMILKNSKINTKNI